MTKTYQNLSSILHQDLSHRRHINSTHQDVPVAQWHNSNKFRPLKVICRRWRSYDWCQGSFAWIQSCLDEEDSERGVSLQRWLSQKILCHSGLLVESSSHFEILCQCPDLEQHPFLPSEKVRKCFMGWTWLIYLISLPRFPRTRGS